MTDAFARGWPELYVFDSDPLAQSIPVEAAGRRWVWTRGEVEARVTERSPIVFARDALRKRMTEDDLLFFELVVGAGALGEGIATALEELADREWPRVNALSLVAWLDVLLLRVDDRAPLDERVDAVLAKHGAKRPEETLRPDLRNAARLAYRGTPDVFDRWYLAGDANAQSYFLATAGLLPGAETAIRDGAYLSRITDDALAWLAARNVAPPPKPAAPPPADLDTFAHNDAGDEFGFVFLPPAAAAQLVGEDDHTRLTEHVDPISLEPNAVEIYGARGFLFCRTYDMARCMAGDDAFFAYGDGEEGLRAAFAGVAERRWLPLTTVEGPLVGLAASVPFAEATKFDLPVRAGTYDVLSAIQDEDSVPLLWLRRRVA